MGIDRQDAGGMSGAPLSYLESAGKAADTILPLTWFTLIVSIVVCLVIGAMLLGGLRRARRDDNPLEMQSIPITRGAEGHNWIVIGLMVSAIPLAATLVWTLIALAAVAGPPANPALTIDVTGRQWWWDVKYASAQPSGEFATANEIHIPVGVPVLVRLHGGDVIHSFWVPKLSGKTDAIPGQTNLSWLQANHPGIYRGQCTEYCGFQHARMSFLVVAQTPADFQRWRQEQLAPAVPPVTAGQERGLALVEYRCGLCHRVRGTRAGAFAAPDLTHLMSRATLAAGVLENNPGNLGGWIQNPQNIKPGNLMPDQHLSAQELSDAIAYLESLK
jgi:cytochrome c oxidase subunit II